MLDRRRLLAASLGAALWPQAGFAREDEWEHSQISRGDNGPKLYLGDGPYPELLLEAREGDKLEEKKPAVAALLAAGALARAGKRLRPTFPVIRLEDRKHFAVPERALAATVAQIQAALPRLQQRAAETAGLAFLPFERVSLLVLSNALLDNWQIENVEERFLRAERPARPGGRYYHALFQIARRSDLDTQGIYGNAEFRLGDIALSLYGNRRYRARALPRLSAAELAALFPALAGLPERDAKARIALALYVAGREGARVSEELRPGLMALDLAVETGHCFCPCLDAADESSLRAMAASFREPLLVILEGERLGLRRQWQRSPYAATVSENEYLIWWYHYFYSQVTDALIAQNLITLPAAGVATYLSRSS